MLTSSISNTCRCHSVGVSCNFVWTLVFFEWLADVIANWCLFMFGSMADAIAIHVLWQMFLPLLFIYLTYLIFCLFCLTLGMWSMYMSGYIVTCGCGSPFVHAFRSFWRLNIMQHSLWYVSMALHGEKLITSYVPEKWATFYSVI